MVPSSGYSCMDVRHSNIHWRIQTAMNSYYVYVYIDPRNFEEFYYGKGKGSRKNAHLKAVTESGMDRRIRSIKKEGLIPIIRVIASNLTEKEALLIEATLIWKLGKFTANVASGHFAEKFRPHDTLHTELARFDFQNGIYYYNVGEGPHRDWDDYRKYGFISAGHGEQWRDQILKFQKGDVVAAYLKKRGFVGIGRIREPAKKIKDVEIRGKRLLDFDLRCKSMGDHSNNKDKSEYVALVEWIKAVPREEAKWKIKAGIYTTTHIRASLDGQPKTMEFLEKEFDLDLRELVV